MKKTASLFFALSLMLASFTAGAQTLRGDVDLDGSVTIADVTSLIDYLLSGQWPEDEHKWVDLGLPTGTLWATCNVGATNPEDYGDYFAWGETEPKEVYNWETYKWCNGSENTLTKYCTNTNYGYNGFTDGKTELDPEDDAAYVNWGPSWRMPTLEQQQELIDCCTWTWTTRNGMNGLLVTGPNGKTMFLPAAGDYWQDYLDDAGSWGSYWSRALCGSLPDCAYPVGFGSGGWGLLDITSRDNGHPVRAVFVSHN